MGYKLLVTDIDGTLTNSRRDIPDENLQAILSLMESGFLYTFATGRCEAAAEEYARQLGANAPAILYNGAKIVDFRNSATLFERSLPRDSAVRVVELAAGYDVRVVAYVKGRVCVERIDSAVEEYMAEDRIVCSEVGDLARFIANGPDGEGPTKLLIKGDEVLGQLGREIEERIPSLSLTRSSPYYLEALPPGVSKGAALSVLCELVGVDPEHTVAMGDAPNDIEMLQVAGMGIAVENADAAVKRHASAFAPSNDECAVADVIRRFFVIR